MEDLGFGEDKELIQYILQNLSAESKKHITEDIVTDILDYLLDYYEEQGFFEGDEEAEVEIVESDMAAFILQHLQQDRVNITEDQLYEVLDLEYEFDKKNGVFQ